MRARAAADVGAVGGDVEKALGVLTQSLPAAREAFADDPTIPRRMLHTFAKLLVFAHETDMAAKALGGALLGCSSEASLLNALETMVHPSDQPARSALWEKLDELALGTPGRAEVTRFLAYFEGEELFFFDAMDQWRLHHRLIASAGPETVPVELLQRFDVLDRQRTIANELISRKYSVPIRELIQYFAEQPQKDLSCAT